MTNRQRRQAYLRDFNFRELFVDALGWDYLREPSFSLTVDSVTYTLQPLVEKRGIKAYLCSPGAHGNIPSMPVMRRMEGEVTRHAYEHFIIYVDAEKTQQAWQYVKREQGKSRSRLFRYYQGQSGEALAQRLEELTVSLAEEERLSMPEMAGRVQKAFDVERVTRKFYDRFKLEHTAFLDFIQNIEKQADREWYASLMLNRLMFLYFIQRKGFLDTHTPGALDGDRHYLRTRLKRVQEQRGEDQFYTFYRHFLLALFHDGLSVREADRSSDINALLGKVPYLNGGLFDVHVLERQYPAIDIPDEAFVKLFRFFDDFEWHLDTRPLRNDREINPDVLGYIFEKYINQKQMGAYYTKEDITGYISKNTIIPFLCDAAEQKCMVAFSPGGPVWLLLRDDPDRYIYDAVKKGCDLQLPPAIEAGVQDVARRGAWNKPAPEEYALPTESWREVVARRARYAEVRAKLAAGEITSINDLITYNLDIQRFAEDTVTYCEGTNLLRAFYECIESVSVLDPTCGSGAFLFAALNILERLYEACLERMQNMVEERDMFDAALPPASRRGSSDLTYFRQVLRRVEQHPSRNYFIYKSIIVNNLYGVDLMEEATEICKLRLFLKLVSEINEYRHIEPLPDIDFNIRAGNTLVGFASQDETQKAIRGRTVGKGTTRAETAFQDQMLFDGTLQRIEEKAKEIERAFHDYRKIQTDIQLEAVDMAANKQRIRDMLNPLRAELDRYLASEYGIDQKNMPQKETYEKQFAAWQQSHQPFHWWVEFYSIMKEGGFDVIIGNPPYMKYAKVKQTYQIRDYQTLATSNLYVFVMERSLRLSRTDARFGMIVPVSSISSESFQPLVKLFLPHPSWISSYSNRPGKLFDGVEQRLSIVLVKIAESPRLFMSPYQHWYEKERESLFSRLCYIPASRWKHSGMLVKSGTQIAANIFTRLIASGHPLSSIITAHGDAGVWVHDGPTYWVRALSFEPNTGMKCQRSNHYHRLSMASRAWSLALAALLNSSTFYLFFKMISNCRDLGQKEWALFPLGTIDTSTLEMLARLGGQLEKNLQATAVMCSRRYPSGTIQYEEYYPAKSKPIIDEIDRVLACHYGFTEEEVDFIINYDIKYRVGRDGGDEDGE